MSLRVTLTCDGHRHGDRCRSERVTGHGYSPSLRSDDPDRRLVTPGLLEGWRIAHAPHGGDLCPSTDHDEDPPQPAERCEHGQTAVCDRCGFGQPAHDDEPRTHDPHPHLEHARQVLAARRENDGLT